MNTRCTNCSKQHVFGNLHEQKLSDHKCDCGGKLEMMGCPRVIDEEKTYNILPTTYITDTYIIERNRKRERFILNAQGYYIYVG
jgi:DNA-directed RNA polymerase subunit RPC12/RpoP